MMHCAQRVVKEAQRNPAGHELRIGQVFRGEGTVRPGDGIGGPGVILAQRAPDLALAEVPPVIRVGQIGIVGIERAQKRPQIVIGVFAA